MQSDPEAGAGDIQYLFQHIGNKGIQAGRSSELTLKKIGFEFPVRIDRRTSYHGSFYRISRAKDAHSETLSRLRRWNIRLNTLASNITQTSGRPSRLGIYPKGNEGHILDNCSNHNSFV